MISISLCSEEGLFMNADKRIWSNEDKIFNALPLIVNVFAYENPKRWQEFAKDLNVALGQRWPNELNSQPSIATQLKTSPL